MKVNKDALLEYEGLKQNYLFSYDTLTILVHNLRSLSKHVDYIVSD